MRTQPGDNLAIHKALDVARPDEIMTIEAEGAVDRAILGGLVGYRAKQRGVAALVVDGVVRDRSGLDAKAPPVVADGYGITATLRELVDEILEHAETKAPAREFEAIANGEWHRSWIDPACQRIEVA